MIFAMFAMVLLTTIVGLFAFKDRYYSVIHHKVSISTYRLTQTKDLPDKVIKTTRCFNNMFEVPMLFYIVCLLYIVLQLENVPSIILAGLFVVFRVIHAAIFLSYNNVLHRMTAFWLAYLVMIIMWLYLILQSI